MGADSKRNFGLRQFRDGMKVGGSKQSTEL